MQIQQICLGSTHLLFSWLLLPLLCLFLKVWRDTVVHIERDRDSVKQRTTDRVTKEKEWVKEWVSQKKKKTFDKLTSPLRHSLWVSSLCRSSAVPSHRTSLGGFCFSGSFSPLWFHRTENHWKLCRLLEIKSARFDVGLAVWLKYSNGLSWCNPADTAATYHAWPWPNSVSITKFHP